MVVKSEGEGLKFNINFLNFADIVTFFKQSLNRDFDLGRAKDINYALMLLKTFNRYTRDELVTWMTFAFKQDNLSPDEISKFVDAAVTFNAE